VHGLPEIGQVEQLCEACQAGKQRCTSFLVKAEYRARRCLELVHSDLCGPITPAMPRGNKYFLLVMDDLNRYMWVTVIPSKDSATAAIKEIQARAEGESSMKLRPLCLDCGGEFTVREFMEYYMTGRHASSAHYALQPTTERCHQVLEWHGGGNH
jgi:hypothetical protein